eukprot:scaffold236321_cov19-Tisochrysis_lutea.AAC.1
MWGANQDGRFADNTRAQQPNACSLIVAPGQLMTFMLVSEEYFLRTLMVPFCFDERHAAGLASANAQWICSEVCQNEREASTLLASLLAEATFGSIAQNSSAQGTC